MLVTDEKRMATKQIMKSLQWRVRKGLAWRRRIRARSCQRPLNESIDGGLMNLIHYADRRSMIYSMESRMPFLDHRIVEFNASVPGVYKIARASRYYARLAFDGLLPTRSSGDVTKMDGMFLSANGWITNCAAGLMDYLRSSTRRFSAVLPRSSGKSLEHLTGVINLMHFLRSVLIV